MKCKNHQSEMPDGFLCLFSEIAAELYGSDIRAITSRLYPVRQFGNI